VAHGEEANRRDAQHVEEAGELVLDDIGQRVGTSAARQASSPCVNVVSMPLPE
jgi:hypothetical protein